MCVFVRADLQHESASVGALRGARELHPLRLQIRSAAAVGPADPAPAAQRAPDAADDEEEEEEHLSSQQHGLQVK